MAKRGENGTHWTELGFFRRAGELAEGLIGPMRATFDRHRGGVLTLQSRDTSVSPIRLAARVRVSVAQPPSAVSPSLPPPRGEGRREGINEAKHAVHSNFILLRQEADPDPRLIIAEQGPVRIWMRVMFSLLDDAGRYHGDGLTDAIIYHDGEVRLALALRLINSFTHEAVTDAWIEMDCSSVAGVSVDPDRRGAKRQNEPSLSSETVLRFRDELTGQCVALRGRTGGVSAGYYSLDGQPYDKLGVGVGIWHGPNDRAPWYDTWGNLYSQWQGLSGWGGHETGTLTIAPCTAEGGCAREFPSPAGGGGRGEGNGGCVQSLLRLNWHWLRGVSERCGANFGMRALLGMYFDADAGAATNRLRDSFKPVLPKSDFQFRCLDVAENTLLYRETGEASYFKFPGKKHPGRARLRVIPVADDSFRRVWDPEVISQAVLDGGLTDDPYGPNMARPGDRFVPIIADPSHFQGSMIMSIERVGRPLSFAFGFAGFSASYLRWDDRQLYVLRRGWKDIAQPDAVFSVRSLCLHDLQWACIDESRRSGHAIVRLPLYWYPTNVQTQGHCANLPVQMSFRPEPYKLAFQIQSTDPAGNLCSSVECTLSFARQAQIAVQSQLEIRQQYDLPEIQFLNMFPYNSWRTEDWETDWVFTMDDAGHETTYFIKEPRGKSVVGDQATHWSKRFFLAQGARDRGNLFVLCNAPRASKRKHRYVLCRCWLDSHFSIDELKTPVPAGTKLAMNYVVAIAGDKRLSRAEAAEIGRRAITTGRLETHLA